MPFSLDLHGHPIRRAAAAPAQVEAGQVVQLRRLQLVAKDVRLCLAGMFVRLQTCGAAIRPHSWFLGPIHWAGEIGVGGREVGGEGYTAVPYSQSKSLKANLNLSRTQVLGTLLPSLASLHEGRCLSLYTVGHEK